MPTTASPRIAATCARIAPPDQAARDLARGRLNLLTMPHWALGRIMDLAVDLAGITGSNRPVVARKTVVVMAGDHGVCAEGVSAYPAEVTPQMVANIAAGGAGINALASVTGARVVIADLGVAADLTTLVRRDAVIDAKIAPGTANLVRGPAMTRAQAIRAIEAGIAIAEDLAPTTDVFATGDMGIGNTTPSACITAACTRREPAQVTGRGTGLDDAALSRKTALVAQALALHRPDPADGIGLLAAVGGFEIGGLAGLCLGAAALGKPVVVDGFISTAAALVAQAICPAVAPRLIFAHRSVEAGHQAALERLGGEPYLDLSLRLGEGSGAALALPLLDAAVAVLTQVATFAEAAVSAKTEV